MRKGKPLLTKPDIDWLIGSMKLVFPTKEESTEKYDNVMKKLDTFIGEVKARREEQTLHAGDHDRIDRRVSRVEKKLNLPPLVD